jgi:hypothetical protein
LLKNNQRQKQVLDSGGGGHSFVSSAALLFVVVVVICVLMALDVNIAILWLAEKKKDLRALKLKFVTQELAERHF